MNKNTLLLIVIILLGLILRIVWINTSPPSLYGDELTIALDANSLLHTGTDQLGNLLPLTFPMGAGRPAGYVYGSIPFIAMLGTTAVGVRVLSILSGLGIIILLFFLGRKLFTDKVGLAASFIAAVSPWDIALSRGGFEAHFALFLALLGVYFFIKAKEEGVFYIFSTLCFGLTLHTYPTYKISLILFLPLLLWYQGVKSGKYFFIGVVLFFVLGILALSQTFIGGSETRFSDINLFSQDKLKSNIEQKINLERNISNLSWGVKYFHNKPVEYSKVFIENYLQNFSIDFLVLHGDRNPRHNMATMGELLFAEVALVLFGILNLWQKNRRLFIFLFAWILIAPVPTAIVDLPHALRSSFMLPPLIIFAALGLVGIWNTKNKVMLTVITFLFIIQFIFFIQKILFLAPNEYSNFWSYSAKVASELALQNLSKYKYIFLSDRIDNIEFAYPVYGNVDPSLVISQNKNRINLGGLKFKKFDNVYIGHIPDSDTQKFLDSLGSPYLYVGSPDSSKDLKNYQVIEGKDHLPILVKGMD